MAYETGSATGIEDLVSKLCTFAAANGWSQAFDGTTNIAYINRNSVYAGFRWDGTTQTVLAMYQALGYSSGVTNPHQQSGDSGSGSTTSPATTERQVNFVSSGPYTSYHFFASGDAPYYVHAAVEVDPGRFRHFGFGELTKYGNWRGGEYVYGHYWNQTANYIDVPDTGQHAFGLDIGPLDYTSMTLYGPDFPLENSATRWAVFGSTIAPGNDTAGNPRAIVGGTTRRGLWTYLLSWIPVSSINAYKPLIPIEVIYFDPDTAPDTYHFLGRQRDVCVVNMKHLAPGDEFTVGTDTWKVFPWVRKQYLNNNTEESRNGGLAYRKFS